MIKYNKGFTLIELIIVVMIIGILALVAIPAYNQSVNKNKTITSSQPVTASEPVAVSEPVDRNVPHELADAQAKHVKEITLLSVASMCTQNRGIKFTVQNVEYDISCGKPYTRNISANN